MKIKKILTISILAIVLPTTGWSLWNYLYINRIEEGLVRVNVRNFTGIENLELTGIVYSVQDLKSKQGKRGYDPARIIRLNIVKSNMDEHRPTGRNEQKDITLCLCTKYSLIFHRSGWYNRKRSFKNFFPL